MRIVLAFVISGCARAPAPVLAAHRADATCDEAAWRQLVTSSLRARVDDRDVVVVEERRGMSHIAIRAFGAILAGEVADRRLVRVVTHETPVWDGPGGTPLPGLVVEPGMAVSGLGAWLEVDERYPITIHGYVPASATGHVWDAQPPPDHDGRRLGFSGNVLAEPVATAQHVAGIAGGDYVIDALEAGPAGWLKVTAHDAQVHVAGWVAIPPPSRPSPLLHTYDFSDDTIEGDLVTPDAATKPVRIAPGCLRAGPSERAAVVGLATQPITATRATGDWLHVVLDTPWGKVDAFGRAEPPPPPDGSAAWTWPDDYGRGAAR